MDKKDLQGIKSFGSIESIDTASALISALDRIEELAAQIAAQQEAITELADFADYQRAKIDGLEKKVWKSSRDKKSEITEQRLLLLKHLLSGSPDGILRKDLIKITGFNDDQMTRLLKLAMNRGEIEKSVYERRGNEVVIKLKL